MSAERRDLLRVRGLTRTYETGKGIHSVTFSLREGRLVALVGPNGAGKTTLLGALAAQAGFTKGQVALKGVDPSQGALYKSLLAYLPEQRGFPPYLSPRITAYLAESFWRQNGLAQRFYREAAELALDHESLDIPISMISQGNREKLALALVFSREAELYILDEPEAHLDPIIRERLESRISRLRADGKSVLLATHDVYMAVRLADEILAIQNGHLRILGEAQNASEVLTALRAMEVQGD